MLVFWTKGLFSTNYKSNQYIGYVITDRIVTFQNIEFMLSQHNLLFGSFRMRQEEADPFELRNLSSALIHASLSNNMQLPMNLYIFIDTCFLDLFGFLYSFIIYIGSQYSFCKSEQ